MNWLASHKEIIDLASVFATAFATVILTWFTATLVRQTKLANSIAQNNAEPDVFLTMWPSEQAPNCINLVLANTGGGNAYDVQVKFADRDGVVEFFPENNTLNFFNLKSGAEIKRFVTDCLDKKSRNFQMTLTYKNSKNKAYEASYALDLELLAQSWMDIDKNWVHEQYCEVKKIADVVKGIGSGFKKIKVDAFSSEDRQKENEMREQHIAKMREQATQDAA